MEKGDGLFAIGGDVEVVGDACLAEGFPGEADVARAVFDKEDFDRFFI